MRIVVQLHGQQGVAPVRGLEILVYARRMAHVVATKQATLF